MWDTVLVTRVEWGRMDMILFSWSLPSIEKRKRTHTKQINENFREWACALQTRKQSHRMGQATWSGRMKGR